MANPISNMMGNIPPKARIMLILTVLIVTGALAYVFSGVFGSPSPVGIDTAAKIDLPPSTDKIRKDSPLDEALFSSESEVGKVYAEAEKADYDAASSKTNTSHLDAMRIRLDSEEKTRRAKKELDAENERIAREKANEPTELEKLMQKRQAERDEREARQQNQIGPGGQQVMPIADMNNPMQQYISEELQFAELYVTAYSQKVDNIAITNGLVATPYYETGASSSERSKSIQETENERASGYDKFIAGTASTRTNQTQAREAQNSSESRSNNRDYADDYDEGDYDEQDVSYDYPGERLSAMTMSKAKKVENVIVGDTFYAVLQIGVNTDEISPIRAVIVDKGKLHNAVLVGNPVRTGEKAVLNFDRMSINGKSFSVSAVALDPDTMRTAMADGVDRHTVERYGKLFAASFVDGYASSLTGGQTTTNTDGSSSTILDRVPSGSDQLLVGLGKVGSKFSPIFERGFDRPPTVTVEPNKAVVLMFMDDISLSKN